MECYCFDHGLDPNANGTDNQVLKYLLMSCRPVHLRDTSNVSCVASMLVRQSKPSRRSLEICISMHWALFDVETMLDDSACKIVVTAAAKLKPPFANQKNAIRAAEPRP